jgi:hypothetical protein
MTMGAIKKGTRATSQLLCNLHRTGVSPYAIGKRWYTADCPTCEEKRAAGKVGPEDPTASELGKRYGNNASNRKKEMHRARIRDEGGTL